MARRPSFPSVSSLTLPPPPAYLSPRTLRPADSWLALAITSTILLLLFILLTIPILLCHHRKQQRDTEHTAQCLDLECLPTHQNAAAAAAAAAAPSLRSSNPNPNPNPHPFGSHAWFAHENAQAPQSETDALTIASMQAQIRMLEEVADVWEHVVEVQQGRNKGLLREVETLKKRMEEEEEGQKKKMMMIPK